MTSAMLVANASNESIVAARAELRAALAEVTEERYPTRIDFTCRAALVALEVAERWEVMLPLAAQPGEERHP